MNNSSHLEEIRNDELRTRNSKLNLNPIIPLNQIDNPHPSMSDAKDSQITPGDSSAPDNSSLVTDNCSWVTANCKKRRKRLSKKQLAFIKELVFTDIPVENILDNNQIRRRTLDRWLTKPIFIKELQMNFRFYNLQTQIELARSTPRAIVNLTLIKNRTMKFEELRKACNDILRYQNHCAEINSRSKKDKNGAFLDRFGELLAQFGVNLDKNGIVSDTFDLSKDTQNQLQNTVNGTKNPDSADFPRLLNQKRHTR